VAIADIQNPVLLIHIVQATAKGIDLLALMIVERIIGPAQMLADLRAQLTGNSRGGTGIVVVIRLIEDAYATIVKIGHLTNTHAQSLYARVGIHKTAGHPQGEVVGVVNTVAA